MSIGAPRVWVQKRPVLPDAQVDANGNASASASFSPTRFAIIFVVFSSLFVNFTMIENVLLASQICNLEASSYDVAATSAASKPHRYLMTGRQITPTDEVFYEESGVSPSERVRLCSDFILYRRAWPSAGAAMMTIGPDMLDIGRKHGHPMIASFPRG